MKMFKILMLVALPVLVSELLAMVPPERPIDFTLDKINATALKDQMAKSARITTKKALAEKWVAIVSKLEAAITAAGQSDIATANITLGDLRELHVYLTAITNPDIKKGSRPAKPAALKVALKVVNAQIKDTEEAAQKELAE